MLRDIFFGRREENGSDDTFVQHAGWLCVGSLKLQDSTLIMQLLRDNLTLWTSDGEGVEG